MSENNFPWLVLVAVGCVVGFCVLGILAAIAIPAFMKYLKRSKTAESEQIVAQIAQSAKSHYQTNQRFPGGNITIRSASEPPEGGAKSKVSPPSSAQKEKVRRILGWPQPNQKLYFQYTYSASGRGNDAEATVKAKADFNPDSKAAHTVSQKLEVKNGTVSIHQPVTAHEFE